MQKKIIQKAIDCKNAEIVEIKLEKLYLPAFNKDKKAKKKKEASLKLEIKKEKDEPSNSSLGNEENINASEIMKIISLKQNT